MHSAIILCYYLVLDRYLGKIYMLEIEKINEIGNLADTLANQLKELRGFL